MGSNRFIRAEPSPSWPETRRAEPSRAGPGRAEPSRAEPSQAEPSRAEPSRARAETSRDEPSRAELGRAELRRAEPSRAERNRADSSRKVRNRAETSRAGGDPRAIFFKNIMFYNELLVSAPPSQNISFCNDFDDFAIKTIIFYDEFDRALQIISKSSKNTMFYNELCTCFKNTFVYVEIYIFFINYTLFFKHIMFYNEFGTCFKNSIF